MLVALGSSFAAGPGIPRGQTYPALVASQLGLSLQDSSKSGAVTADVLGGQLAAVGPEATVVTVTVGGNDLGYAGGLMKAGLVHRGSASTDGAPVAAALIEIVARCSAAAPDARVVLVDYLTVIAGPARGLVLTAGQRAHFAEVQTVLEGAFASAAAASGALLVRASAASRDHAVGSAQPWVTPWSTLGLLRGRVPYHPNVAGMAAVAELVVEALAAG